MVRATRCAAAPSLEVLPEAALPRGLGRLRPRATTSSGRSRGQLRYAVQCCGFTVEYIRYNWNGRDEKQWRFNLELANVGSIGNFLGAGVEQRQGSGATGEAARHRRRRLRGRPPRRLPARASTRRSRSTGVVLPHGGAVVARGLGARASSRPTSTTPRRRRPSSKRSGPSGIVHLAGQSSVHHSWLDPGGTLRTNVLGIVHLLDAVRRQGLRPAVLVVGSAEEYGPVAPERAADPRGRRRCGPPRPTR